jgi:hypothetical protein
MYSTARRVFIKRQQGLNLSMLLNLYISQGSDHNLKIV